MNKIAPNIALNIAPNIEQPASMHSQSLLAKENQMAENLKKAKPFEVLKSCGMQKCAVNVLTQNRHTVYY